MISAWVDGGSRGNGTATAQAYGYYLIEGDTLVQFGFGLGTNNEAELKAFIELLRALRVWYPVDEITIHVDSANVIGWVTGAFKVRTERLRVLVLQAQQLLEPLDAKLVKVSGDEMKKVLGH